jgi:opacity protein-like surface antigen
MKVARLALTLAVVCSGAMAEPFSYTYGEIGYFNQTDHVDGVPGNNKIESDGYTATISADFGGAILQLTHNQGDINRIFGDNPKDFDESFKLRSTGVFFGGHGEPDAKTSFFGGVGYDRSTLDTDTEDSQVDVYRFGGGVRYWVVPHVELDAEAFYVHAENHEFDESSNDGRIGVGVRFQPINMVSVGAKYFRLIDAESDAFTADVRLQF